MSDPFRTLPDSARLWVFGTSRPVASDEVRRLLAEVDAFIDRWKAHGHPLAAARSWVEERFLLVAVDDRITPPSGCSIDALVRILRRMEGELDLKLLGNDPIWYRDAATGEILRVSRPEFREAVGRGEVTGDTRVFDPTLTRVAELREGKLELHLSGSWHRAFLPK